MADTFKKRKIGEENMLREEFIDERAFDKPRFNEKKEQEFRKRKNEVSPQEAIVTLNFAIRKALAEGADQSAAVLGRIREESLEQGEDTFFEGMDFNKLRNQKPALIKKRRLR